MPEISRFYGIAISIYFKMREHNPPHFHATYGDYEAEYRIDTLELLEGSLPKTADSLVKEWATLHRDKLLDIWNTQIFTKIEPLE